MIPALLDQEVSTQEGGAKTEKREENLGSLAFKSAATSNAQTRAGTETKRLKVPPLFSSPTGCLIN